ncbi:MAG: hypothetical protein RLZZ476_1786, partial [Verrucomicrobiota bacterium]
MVVSPLKILLLLFLLLLLPEKRATRSGTRLETFDSGRK